MLRWSSASAGAPEAAVPLRLRLPLLPTATATRLLHAPYDVRVADAARLQQLQLIVLRHLNDVCDLGQWESREGEGGPEREGQEGPRRRVRGVQGLLAGWPLHSTRFPCTVPRPAPAPPSSPPLTLCSSSWLSAGCLLMLCGSTTVRRSGRSARSAPRMTAALVPVAPLVKMWLSCVVGWGWGGEGQWASAAVAAFLSSNKRPHSRLRSTHSP